MIVDRLIISIHSLRVEGDILGVLETRWHIIFQSTPSVWRETCSHFSGYTGKDFNPLPPCGGRPCCGSAMWNFCSISIHSLRVEGDAVVLLQFLVHVEFQSTPSVWRETPSVADCSASPIFQSTPSVWRETYDLWQVLNQQAISIHSLRVEGDQLVSFPFPRLQKFQSTPSVWRETAWLRLSDTMR